MTDRAEVCVGAIAVNDGDLLLIRRGHGPAAGEWSVPGGRLEPDEMVAEAVTRELREETGLEGVCGELIGWTEIFDDDRHFIILDFEVTVFDREPLQAGDDAAEARWVPLSDVAEMNLVNGLAEFLYDHEVIDTIS